jgi:hypothetical protein
MWESLVGLREKNPLFDASLDNSRPIPLPKPSRRNRRTSRPVIVAAPVLGILLLGVVIDVKTDKGRIKIDVKDPDAIVEVEHERVRIQTPKDGDPAEITPLPDGRGVRLKQGGSETSGEELTVKSGGSQGTSVRIEPPAAPHPSKVDQGRFVLLFNGKDLTNWRYALDNGGEWAVADSVLEGRGNGQGNAAVLVTERQDFANFHLRLSTAPRKEQGAGSSQTADSQLDDSP